MTTVEPTEQPDPPEAEEMADTFPVLMVYSTLRLSVMGGWRWNVRVATPDNINVIMSNATAGGSVEIGARKAVKYFDDAIAIAMEHVDPCGEAFP